MRDRHAAKAALLKVEVTTTIAAPQTTSADHPAHTAGLLHGAQPCCGSAWWRGGWVCIASPADSWPREQRGTRRSSQDFDLVEACRAGELPPPQAGLCVAVAAALATTWQRLSTRPQGNEHALRSRGMHVPRTNCVARSFGCASSPCAVCPRV